MLSSRGLSAVVSINISPVFPISGREKREKKKTKQPNEQNHQQHQVTAKQSKWRETVPVVTPSAVRHGPVAADSIHLGLAYCPSSIPRPPQAALGKQTPARGRGQAPTGGCLRPCTAGPRLRGGSAASRRCTEQTTARTGEGHGELLGALPTGRMLRAAQRAQRRSGNKGEQQR